MASKCQGIALLTVLLMVALASIAAATLLKRQVNSMQAVNYLQQQNQALLYAMSAENFLQALLLNDMENSADVDHQHEIWAKPMPVFPIENGYIQGVLEDQSGRFNLNCLLDAQGQVNQAAKIWFEQLLTRVGLPAELSQAVIDWQDSDDQVMGAMGAESAYYQGLPQHYLPANHYFYSIEELKQVRGFEGDKFNLIAPYVAANPNIASRVNINMATAVVLASLSDSLDLVMIQNELDQRKQNLQYFKNVNELWALKSFSAMDNRLKQQFIGLLTVQSDYFQARIEVTLANTTRQWTSYLVKKIIILMLLIEV